MERPQCKSCFLGAGNDFAGNGVPAIRKLMPFVVGIYYKCPINNAWTFDVRSWAEFGRNNALDDPSGATFASITEHMIGQLYVEPKITYCPANFLKKN